MICYSSSDYADLQMKKAKKNMLNTKRMRKASLNPQQTK